MKYTTTNEGDQIVEADMQKIAKAGKGAESLILYGSYGRGEGLVLDGVPRNDYDILMVGGDPETQKLVERADTKCINEVLRINSPDLKDVACSQQWYEIKYASRLLGGKPLDLPDWEPYDIPYTDAVNSLERRAVSMIVGKWEMRKDTPDMRKVTEQISKGIIAIGDATLIKRGQFHPKYSIRALMLSQDDIAGLYNLAVSTKILGTPELENDTLWELWERTRQTMREYSAINQLDLQIGEILFGISDRTTEKELEKMVKRLAGDTWL